MPRPVARPLPPRPVVSLPRWIIAAGSLMILVMGAAALLWRINKTNDRLQAEQRLTADPSLGRWLAGIREEIQASEETGSTGPDTNPRARAEAVWLGRITSLDYTNKQGEGPRLSDITLSPAHLVAGRRGPMDPRGAGKVSISVLGYDWPRGEPREGEPWVVAVRRINKGNNIAHTAYPAP